MNRRTAFTLIELLTVIVIMGILAGILLPALNKARKQAQVAKCIAMISSLQTALGMYQVDYGLYPPSATSATQHNGNSHENTIFGEGAGEVNNLVAALAATTLGGPYMEFKAGSLIDASGGAGIDDANRYVLRDPWGQAYIYVARKYQPGTNVSTSYGPFHPHNDDANDRNNNSYNIYSLGPDKKTYDNQTCTESDWDDTDLFNDTDGREGHWKNITDKDDGRYDDINSWDGSRSFGGG